MTSQESAVTGDAARALAGTPPVSPGQGRYPITPSDLTALHEQGLYLWARNLRELRRRDRSDRVRVRIERVPADLPKPSSPKTFAEVSSTEGVKEWGADAPERRRLTAGEKNERLMAEARKARELDQGREAQFQPSPPPPVTVVSASGPDHADNDLAALKAENQRLRKLLTAITEELGLQVH